MCLGANEIILDEFAQLGPLDTQIYEEKKAGRREYESALNPFKTLEQLQKFSIQMLDDGMKMIYQRSGMDLDNCLKHAISFVEATTGPLFGKAWRVQPRSVGRVRIRRAPSTPFFQYGPPTGLRYHSAAGTRLPVS
jgi:hypothetical protein